MNIQINYNATTNLLPINETMQLGDILEKTLSHNHLMIHEIYGIYFVENNKINYFGSDDVPLHFTWKRFSEEFKNINNLFLQTKNEKNGDNFSDTLMQRYILFLSTKEDEIIARSFEQNSNPFNQQPLIPPPMQLFNPNFYINMNPVNMNIDANHDNNQNVEEEVAEEADENLEEEEVEQENIDNVPQLQNNIIQEFINIFNQPVQNNNLNNQRIIEFLVPLNNLNQQPNNNNQNQNNQQPDIERIFNLQNLPIQYSPASNNIGALMDNLQNLINNAINQQINNAQNMENVKVVLTQEQINELPKGPYQEVKRSFRVDSNQCGMSLEDFEDDTEIMVLPCYHAFQQEYISKWLTENSNKCPTCRAEVAEGTPLEE